MDQRDTLNHIHLDETRPGGRFLRLADADGYRIVSMSGDLWITTHNSPEDIILRSGDAVTLESRGAALIMALGSADVEVVPPPAREDLSAVWVDAVEHFDEYDRAARRLRAEAFADVAGWIGCELRRLGRRITAALGATVGPVTPCRAAA